jgi:hypothetical protein
MSTAAQQLAQWIEATHPELFQTLFAYVQTVQAAQRLRQSRLRGFGDDDDLTYFVPDYPDTSAGYSAPAAPSFDIPTVNVADLQSVGLPGATDVTVSSPISTPLDSNTLDVSTDNSGGGLLQSIGSGIASAASSVGNYLTSAQGLNTVAKLATAYFQVQNTQAQAQLQTQVLQAQLQRAAAGQSPAPLTYAVASNGALIPVYTTSPLASMGVYPANMPPSLQTAIAGGQSQLVTLPDGTTGYTVPPNVVSTLNASLSEWLPYLLLIGGGLLLLKELSR